MIYTIKYSSGIQTSSIETYHNKHQGKFSNLIQEYVYVSIPNDKITFLCLSTLATKNKSPSPHIRLSPQHLQTILS